MAKILITGACGQLGSELTAELRRKHGAENVVASDIREPNPQLGEGPFENLDVMDKAALESVIDRHQVNVIYHLAALLSANAEKNLDLAWKLNMDGLLNVLKLARDKNVERVFWPSSIAVFGPDARKEGTPQNSPTNPATVYGITKVAGEQWCSYFYNKFGVDVRSLRYPGLIGYKSLPGGGTTDYAVDIYHKALAGEPFSCFLERDSALPMMYMSDAVKATIDLMEAPEEHIHVRTSYNVAAISFTPADIAESIKKVLPHFEIRYEPDYRQQIAASWPDSIDDSAARSDWGWSHRFSLDAMTKDILANLPSVIENA
ncbi:NAD-dependent epimerase/dehydratase family protein [Rhodohalobacter mucosus]|uniref:NAD-dependent epimerase n=1 Tax=Rhodohalobacter mucosus TaxID=2079485 RepID=A0A316TQY0_9BACT|nr:NAD-dependent epimerase/dehydratase family protein [Rhodohalobacter mucosus]PWN05435.1 NAD-dependent epimerase [Rhodohalobacter mucosus]